MVSIQIIANAFVRLGMQDHTVKPPSHPNSVRQARKINRAAMGAHPVDVNHTAFVHARKSLLENGAMTQIYALSVPQAKCQRESRRFAAVYLSAVPCTVKMVVVQVATQQIADAFARLGVRDLCARPVAVHAAHHARLGRVEKTVNTGPPVVATPPVLANALIIIQGRIAKMLSPAERGQATNGVKMAADRLESRQMIATAIAALQARCIGDNGVSYQSIVKLAETGKHAEMAALQ